MAIKRKTECFAYKDGECTALSGLYCDNCRFYKRKGTECNTCSHKDKDTCTKCHKTARG